MRHGIKGRKFNRTTSQRRSLLLNLAIDLLDHEQIKTTLPKAKDLRPFVEKLITVSRKGNLAARRHLISVLGNEIIAKKMIEVLGKRYAQRPGGYTRIFKAGYRYGDHAPLAVIELVDRSQNSASVA